MNIVETNAFKPTSDSWTPAILARGGYCSPACGGHRSGVCTIAKFNAAVELAEKLAEHMGDGWMPEVWENLGWHSKIINGEHSSIYIHANDYWIDIHLPGVGQKCKHVDDAITGYPAFLAEVKKELVDAYLSLKHRLPGRAATLFS